MAGQARAAGHTQIAQEHQAAARTEASRATGFSNRALKSSARMPEGEDLKALAELEADFRRQRMQFIHTELDAGVTFAEVARTEASSGNEERARRNLEFASRAYDEARRRLDECRREHAPAAFDSAAEKLQSLGGLIAALQK
jgi:rubrerythrin